MKCSPESRSESCRFAHTLQDELYHQKKCGLFCDLLICHYEQTIPAHSAVLAAFCPNVLKRLTDAKISPMWESPRVIKMTDLTCCYAGSDFNCFECVSRLVEFFYTGKLVLDDLHVDHTLNLAFNLKSKAAFSICYKYKHEQRNVEEVPQDKLTLDRCKICNFYSDDPFLFKLHAVQFHIEAFKCVHCSFIFDNISSLVKHSLDSHREDTPLCSVCLYKAHSSQDFNSHLSRHLSSQPFICCICDGTFAGRKEWLTHDCSLHASKDFDFVCKTCDFSTNDRSLLEKHSTVFHRNTFICLTCGFTSFKLLPVVEHLQTVKHDEAYCSICLFKSINPQHLQSHLKQHLDPTPFTCSKCPLRFNKRQEWLNHASDHEPPRSFSCPNCDSTFKSSILVKNHIQRVHSSKKYSCGECDFTSAYRYKLHQHQSRHARKKPERTKETTRKLVKKKPAVDSKLVCTTCGLGFSLEKNLKRHFKIHEADILQCEACGYSTTRRDKFKVHVSKKHVGDDTLLKRAEDNKAKAREAKGSYSITEQTLVVEKTGEIRIVDKNNKTSVTTKLLNIGNLTGSITLDEITGVLTLNNINSGAVYLNETTGELTYVNFDSEINSNDAMSRRSDQGFNSEIVQLDEVTGEIIKVTGDDPPTATNEDTTDPMFCDMDINDDTLDGFDDFDEMIFEGLDDFDMNAYLIGGTSDDEAMPRLDESTGVLTVEESRTEHMDVTRNQDWSQMRSFEEKESYSHLLDEVTGVFHD